jgi:hypothetical protein
MSALGFATSLRSARSTDIKDALDDGAGNATINFYTGTRPATTGGSLSGNTLLGTCTFPSPCGSVTSGVFTAGTITDDSYADNGGTATWARVISAQGAFVMDMDVGATGAGTPCELSTTAIVQGGRISVSSCVITEGNV